MESVLNRSKIDELSERSEILTMCVKLENMKRNNAKMQSEQERKYNNTVDTLDTLRDNIITAKQENASLLAEIVVGKHKFDRLTHDMEQLKSKFVTCQKELRSFNLEREVRDDTKELLDFTEKRSSKMAKINKKLHVSLPKHNTNPKQKVQVVTKVESTKILRANKSSPVKNKRAINAVSIRQKLSPQKISWS